MTYLIALRGDPVDLNLHLEQLKIARARKALALEQLRTIRRTKPRGPVYLNDPSKSDQRAPVIGTPTFRRFLQLDQ